MKKLSPVQQRVVDALKNNDSYIQRSKYYNHNKVISRVPFKINGREYYCLLQFTSPTFEVLLNNEIIVKSQDGNETYILTK